MSNALVKIVKEAKRIRKLHPNKHRKWNGFVKEAGEKYSKGTIGKRKKAAPKKRAKKATHKRRAPRKKVHRRAKSVGAVRKHHAPRRRTRKRHKKVGAVRRRSSGGGGISTNKLLLLGGLAVGAYLLLKPKTPALPPGAPPLVNTTNPVRNNQAQQILNYAAAGGLAIDAIIKLINALNTKSDAEINQGAQQINQGEGIPGYWIA